MKNQEEVKNDGISPIVELKLTQTDMINILIEKERQKFKSEKAILEKEGTEVFNEIESFLKTSFLPIIETAKSLYQGVIDKILNDHKDLTLFIQPKLIDPYHHYYEGRPSAHNKISEIQSKYPFGLGLILDLTDENGKESFDGTHFNNFKPNSNSCNSVFRFTYFYNEPLEKDLLEISKKLKELKNKESNILMNIQLVKTKLHNLSNNESSIRNNFITQMLDKTVEGKKLLSTIESIQLDPKLLEQNDYNSDWRYQTVNVIELNTDSFK